MYKIYVVSKGSSGLQPVSNNMEGYGYEDIPDASPVIMALIAADEIKGVSNTYTALQVWES